MAAASAVDLIQMAARAHDIARGAKAERARVMDYLIELLFERAEHRHLLTKSLPYVPNDLAGRIEAALNV